MVKDVEIGIFGGTGIYDSGLLQNAQEIEMDTPYGKVWVASASLQTDGDPSSQLFVLSILDEFDDMTPSISYDEGRAAFFVELGELEAKLPKGVSLYRSGNQLVQLSSVPPKDIADGSKILELLEEALRND